jgi:hypothetical protein
MKNTGDKFTLPEPENEDLPPFLKAKDIPSDEPVEAEIIGNARLGNLRYGKGVIFDVKVGETLWALFVKFNTPNYSMLFAKFGNDPLRWQGTIQLLRGSHLGKDYVKVV